MQARRHARCHGVISDDRAQRQTGGERFCDDRYIRLRRKRLKSEVAACPAQSPLNFVGDQQSAVFGRESTGTLPELCGERKDAAFALNRFQNDCANGIVEFAFEIRDVVEFVKFNDVADLEGKFDDTVCAIILETIQGEGGIFPLTAEFWERARALTTKHGALLIADEIQWGLGRTGRYFAFQAFPSKPDIAVVAKPLAAGLPLGAIITNNAVASRVSPGLHGTTFGGGPMICAVALEFLNIVEDEKLLGNIRARGDELRAGLEKLRTKFDFIKEVRGAGCMLGVELSVEGGPFVAEALKRGLLINCTHDFTIRLLPSFLISKAQVREFLNLFEKILSETPRVVPATESSSKVPLPAATSAASTASRSLFKR